ncbi:hypothetical protein JMJ77_0002142 [Colletotrichum scovillei]|uniref:Uncharacterized protein n=1 Tax=Colletotrichum scovillei TaxID=1209932 RepID=A0A9P7RA55_9PEZI|nr:hypothetical protein JMJ77_0002142 [Colletotrichum scovillei]KAG7070557.1 hypothetical protein JMJ76_0001807 [Colletotrichum scovillei]KAG7078808.1 hypothetical protein JMJ78_0002474 [Colletotrichum scovillei]
MSWREVFSSEQLNTVSSCLSYQSQDHLKQAQQAALSCWLLWHGWNRSSYFVDLHQFFKPPVDIPRLQCIPDRSISCRRVCTSFGVKIQTAQERG